MSDLVERLDAEARVLSNLSDPAWQHSTHQVEWFRERSMLMLEASAEIERLRASLSRAEEALKPFALLWEARDAKRDGDARAGWWMSPVELWSDDLKAAAQALNIAGTDTKDSPNG